MKFDDCPFYLQEYLNYIETIKLRSQLTVKNYYTDIRLFLRYIKINGGLADEKDFDSVTIADVPESLVKKVTLNDLISFLSFTSSERSNHAQARARKAVALRQFFKYLTVKKMWFEVSPAQNLELPSPKKTLPKHLTVEQATELLRSCSDFRDWSDYRDYCIITFFLNCGMRLSELVGINTHDYISTVEGGMSVSRIKVLGKGSKERIIYLNPACVSAYENYIKVRPETREKALFISKRLTRISNRRVEQIIDEKLKLSGLSGMGFSVHKLRHTAATLMYQNGVDVRALKEVLGHENLDTTQIYTHVANEQIRNAMYMNPLANIETKKAPSDDDENE
ncbi:MAG: tyrosine-type recombinase/integrase [Ruminiclostridium sp.]|nr:tyrosine-type recombinase/integrase [Ruminiclostridium sp.]